MTAGRRSKAGIELSSFRGGRLVATARAGLAAWLAAAVLLGRLPPDAERTPVLLLLGVYAPYSLALLVAMRFRRLVFGLSPPNAILTAIDVVFYTVLLYLSSGADSPFFGPLLFVIVAATVQWGSRGASLVGGFVLLGYLPTGWPAVAARFHTADSLTYLVRAGYMSAAIAILIAFGRHVEQLLAETARLSHPIKGDQADAAPPFRECLQHALDVFQARAGMILATEDDEPYGQLLVATPDHWAAHRITPAGGDWIDPEISGHVFLFDRERRQTLVGAEGRISFGPGQAISDSVLRHLQFSRALVIPARAENVETWIVVADYADKPVQDIAAGMMVSAQVSVFLERWRAQALRRQTAAREERMRLARDLHDGVLQFLAATGLQLEALARSEELTRDARARLRSLLNGLTDEQIELRRFITGTRRGGGEPVRKLGRDLDDLAGRLSRHWSIEVAVAVRPHDLDLGDSMSFDIGRILRETVANAVRHGHATRVDVDVRRERGRLRLRICDNGVGFGLDADWAAGGLQTIATPRSLAERVQALHGALEIGGGDRGAIITVDLPMPEQS